MLGILNINKPIDVTSRDIVTRVVQSIRNVTGQKCKAGHAGTLDPLASGVLIVCLGKATRLIPYIQRSLKTYYGTFQVDVTSDSADTESQITNIETPVKPSLADIENVLPRFLGNIQQKPPAYSAISIGGQRAYKLARKGVEFDIPSKEVYIDQLVIESYQYPVLKLRIQCGSGTYIRSLGRDLLNALGSDAVMTELIRTSIGSFEIDSALHENELDFESIENGLINPLVALSGIPSIRVGQSHIDTLTNGRFIDPLDFDLAIDSVPDEIVAMDESSRLVAIVEPIENMLKAKINFR